MLGFIACSQIWVGVYYLIILDIEIGIQIIEVISLEAMFGLVVLMAVLVLGLIHKAFFLWHRQSLGLLFEKIMFAFALCMALDNI
jgi:hypothetical protein